MNDGARSIVILAAVAAAIVVGFVVASPGGDDEEPAAQRPTAAETQPEPSASLAAETSRPRRPPLVRVRGGKPVGGVRTIRVDRGDQVRFGVDADVADHVHVHGYDVSEDVAPGRNARFRFRADIEGVFEVELEDRGEQIARLTVEP